VVGDIHDLSQLLALAVAAVTRSNRRNKACLTP
jgi:hypothetical protein